MNEQSPKEVKLKHEAVRGGLTPTPVSSKALYFTRHFPHTKMTCDVLTFRERAAMYFTYLVVSSGEKKIKDFSNSSNNSMSGCQGLIETLFRCSVARIGQPWLKNLSSSCSQLGDLGPIIYLL